MQAFFGLLEFITSITLLVGLVAVIKPFGLIKRRKHATGVIAASVLAGMVAAPFAPHPPPSKAAPASASGQPANASAAAVEPKPKPETPITGDVKASFLKTQTHLFETVKPCDQALAKARKVHGQYASYNISTIAHQACLQAAIDLNDLHFEDPLPADARDDLDKALNCFGLAYSGEAGAMDDAGQDDGHRRCAPLQGRRIQVGTQ